MKNTLEVPHQGRNLSFALKPYGWINQRDSCDNYFNIEGRIKSGRLRVPTFAETVSLVYASLNFNGECHNEAARLAINPVFWLWASTANLYSREEGVYVQDNPRIEESELIMNRETLLKKLEQKDSSVRFVPFGFKERELTPRELEKHPLIVALAGEEGAEKLSQIARNKYFTGKPWLTSFELSYNSYSHIKEIKRFSTFYYHKDSCGLEIDTLFIEGRESGGHIFGIVQDKYIGEK